MKTVVTGIVLGIVFSITLIFVNRTFASDAPVSPSPVAIHAAYWSDGCHVALDVG